MNKWLISALVIGVLAVVLGIFSYTIYKVYYTDDYDDGNDSEEEESEGEEDNENNGGILPELLPLTILGVFIAGILFFPAITQGIQMQKKISEFKKIQKSSICAAAYDDGKTIFFIEKNGVVSKTKIDDMVDFTYQVEKPTMETNGWFLTIKVPFDFYEENVRDYEKSFV